MSSAALCGQSGWLWLLTTDSWCAQLLWELVIHARSFCCSYWGGHAGTRQRWRLILSATRYLLLAVDKTSAVPSSPEPSLLLRFARL